MEGLIPYLRDCIRPRGDEEFFVGEKWPAVTFKQDALIFLPASAVIPSGIQSVVVGEWRLCRWNKPRDIAWFCEESGKFSWDTSRDPIYRRLVPPPYETLDHVKVICAVVMNTNPQGKTYVEYGVRSGSSIEPVSALVFSAIGVDICGYKPVGKNITFHQMKTDDFSEKILPGVKFHYAFIDADHSAKQVLQDFSHIFNRIQTGGYVFLHDTYPCMAEMIQPRFCNDCFMAPLAIKKAYAGKLEMLTLPLNPGLTIIRKL